jgi:hypothetical protein
MWCIIYVAIASSAPPTDCSLLSETICRIKVGQINEKNWKEDTDTIPYLAQCVPLHERVRYFQARLVEKVKEITE